MIFLEDWYKRNIQNSKILVFSQLSSNFKMNICQEMHQTVVSESIRFKEEQGRYNSVTPTSYLELLSIFSKIFGLKKNQLIQAKKRTKNGLDKVIWSHNKSD